MHKILTLEKWRIWEARILKTTFRETSRNYKSKQEQSRV